MTHASVALFLLAGTLALGHYRPQKIRAKQKRRQDRLQNSGKVIQEILNVPDDIPQDLLDKAVASSLMPSVLKAAFVVGGSYGRGTMVCRTGKDFTGPWGPPAMYALEAAASVSRLVEKPPTSFFLVMNDRGAGSLLPHQGETGSGRIYRRWTEGPFSFCRH